MTHEQDDDALEALFAEAREEVPSQALQARVMADAEAVQQSLRAVHAGPTPAPSEGWLTRIVGELIGGLGGWSAVSGITAAGVVGLGIGLYAPDMVSGWIENDSLSLGIGTFDVAPDVSGLLIGDDDV